MQSSPNSLVIRRARSARLRDPLVPSDCAEDSAAPPQSRASSHPTSTTLLRQQTHAEDHQRGLYTSVRHPPTRPRSLVRRRRISRNVDLPLRPNTRNSLNSGRAGRATIVAARSMTQPSPPSSLEQEEQSSTIPRGSRSSRVSRSLSAMGFFQQSEDSSESTLSSSGRRDSASKDQLDPAAYGESTEIPHAIGQHSGSARIKSLVLLAPSARLAALESAFYKNAKLTIHACDRYSRLFPLISCRRLDRRSRRQLWAVPAVIHLFDQSAARILSSRQPRLVLDRSRPRLAPVRWRQCKCRRRLAADDGGRVRVAGIRRDESADATEQLPV